MNGVVTLTRLLIPKGIVMTDIQIYIETDEESEKGHVHMRERYFECENKDTHLGCDLGIDVAG